ncbi:MAG: hypothetical protein GX604_00320 [Actinobacteria bacterium]|nr:hypothetical protein [Actinomycetota bacterium]
MRRLLGVTVRFAVAWGLQAVSLVVVHWLVPGVRLEAVGPAELAAEAMSVALVLAALNTSVRPALLWLTLPVNVFTLGLFSLVINALMLYMVSWVLPFLVIANFWSALLGSLVLAAVATFLGTVTAIDSQYSFFGGVIDWLALRLGSSPSVDDTRGIIVLEIDGLSRGRLEDALERGLMPFLQTLLGRGHNLSGYDCGLPSQTSSSQAGIMFGSNWDIPGFRWYDKREGRVVSSRNPADAWAMESAVSRGRGLLRGGSSVNNNLSGDAMKTVLTASRALDTRATEQQRGMEDLYLFFLNPYLFPRSLLLAVVEMGREVIQGLRRRLRREWPRAERIISWFPAERAACTVLLRDVGTFVGIIDVMRGLPAIYITYMGYDEVAHHTGPDARDAMVVLRSIDAQIRRIHEAIWARAPRSYDLFILSDHGQAGGATFRQRYGATLAEVIDGFLQDSAMAVQTAGAEATRRPGRELAREMSRLERRMAAEGVRTSTLVRTRRVLEKPRADAEEMDETGAESRLPSSKADVVVCATGNLAHVYFTGMEGRATVDGLEEAHPGLVPALMRHPGVGCIVGRDEDGKTWLFGANGDRCLDDELILGEDPLAPYGPTKLRAGQLKRLAAFPHSGDLIVFSTVYEDGTVASFENLVGCHGGMGGGQTDAFVVHPETVQIPRISNASGLHAVLDGRRGRPAPPPVAQVAVPATGAFRPARLLAGLRDVRRWAALLLRALLLDGSAYAELARAPSMNGPALLLGVLVTGAFGLRDVLEPDNTENLVQRLGGGLLQGAAGWAVLILLGYASARLLKSHGTLAGTMRAVSFAQAPLLLAPLEVVQSAGAAVAIVLLLWTFMAWWVAVRGVFSLRGATAAAAPVVAAAVLVVGLLLLRAMAGGVELTLSHILQRLGVI